MQKSLDLPKCENMPSADLITEDPATFLWETGENLVENVGKREAGI